jgi:hypothetical protein
MKFCGYKEKREKSKGIRLTSEAENQRMGEMFAVKTKFHNNKRINTIVIPMIDDLCSAH